MATKGAHMPTMNLVKASDNKSSRPFVSSVALAKWAKEEMNFVSASQVDVEKLSKNLLPACKGTAISMLWDQVTKQIKSKSQAEVTRGNIKLSELGSVYEKESSEVDGKSRNLHGLQKDIESLELQLKKQKEDLQDTKLLVLNAEENELLLQRKSCMYRNHCEYLKQKNAGVKSFSQWIADLCSAYLKNSDLMMDENDCHEKCLEDVKKLCDLADGGSNVSGTENSTKRYTLIGKLLKTYPTKLIISALTKLSESSTLSLREEVNKTDFLNDLKSLESQIALDENLPDQEVARELASVQIMLQKWNLKYVNGYNQCQTCKRNAENLLKETELERNTIVSQLQRQFEFEPSNLQLAIDRLDAEVELAAKQGCLRSFQATVARLQREIQRKTEARDHLFTVKKKIDGFSDLLAESENRILSITKHNSAVKSKLIDKQSQVLDAARRCVCERRLEMLKSYTDIQTSLTDRLVAFSHADPRKLHQLNGADGTLLPVHQLSIKMETEKSQQNCSMFYQKALQNLVLHSHVSPSAVLQRIIDAKREISRAKILEEKHATNSDDKCKVLHELAEEIVKVEKRQTDSVSLKHKNGMKIVESALMHCQGLDSMIQTWYEQPAQYQTPWLTAEGLTLREWKSKIENP